MDYKDQRKLAAKLLSGKIPSNILKCIEDRSWCFSKIMKELKPYRGVILKIVADETKNIPAEWAYHWAKNIGNRKIMVNLITESMWAFYWAIYIGNREIMIGRIIKSEWAYCWAINIGDEEIMLPRMSAEDKIRFQSPICKSYLGVIT